MSKKNDLNLNIKYKSNIYEFIKLRQGQDGSLYVFFLYSKNPKECIKYSVNFNEKDGLYFEEKECDKVERIELKPKYISYHTTGRVNYHGSNEQVTYFEPTYNIQNINTFFMSSIPQIAQLPLVMEQNKITGEIIDLSEIEDERLNIYFSLFPFEFDDFTLLNNLISAITYNKLYSLVVTYEIDRLNINLEKSVKKNAFLYGEIKSLEYERQVLGKNEAYIKFQQKLYDTKDLILFAPNNEGIFRIVFSVVMRVPPKVNIEFYDDNYRLVIVNNNDTFKLTFKIFDIKSNSYIKDAQKVKIKSISLDSEIY
ncbi:hypothetical protein [Clostridium sp. ZBS12]|uniref:hypothetical protein n=1 Tax=Clostridium sp. ZBS12 TaxID=2949972 RepID=UPI00207A7D4E|nr:hypothetical protein [Clostridium sp. ZBS12]